MKYAARDYEWLDVEQKSLVVHEDEPTPIDTGLLDVNGVKIYRVPTRQPIGFKLK
jgi:hypothetical protein